MITIFLRSSSYNDYDFCQQKYFLSYVLKLNSPANVSAERGTITHKALELLAEYKLAQQKGQDHFIDDQFGRFFLKDFSPDVAMDISFPYFAAKTPEYNWDAGDEKICRKLMWDALLFNDGMFSPLKREIVSAEQYFDFEIKKDWARYNYTIDGKELSGYLSLKGTIDLVVKSDNGIELIDWKTGKDRYDWGKGKEKTYEDLKNDPQLRIYHYALNHLYPNEKETLVTIFYIAAKDPITLNFTKQDLIKTEKMLQKRFNEIRANNSPRLIYPDWKCTKLCWFGKNDFDGEASSYRDSICNSINKEMMKIGLDKVVKKHAKDCTFSSYGSGGSREGVRGQETGDRKE
jgi:ATP-dependent helicase/DNAse subunit B